MTLKGKHMIKSVQRLATRLARARIDSVDLYYLGRILRQLTAATESACKKHGIDLDSATLPTREVVEPAEVVLLDGPDLSDVAAEEEGS